MSYSKKFGIIVFALLLAPSLLAQQLEQYLTQKEAERARRNPFLTDQETEGPNLLQRYYQSLLLQRGKAKLPQAAGAAEEEALLKQLKTGLALEGPINPAQYVVGPFDGMSVNLWSGVPLSFDTFVTPEGTLIIPTVGEIYVANHTLKEVKEIVAREVGKKYSKGEVSVTLVSPRSFVVTVAGVVQRPGAYIVSSVDRVDKAIYLANLLAPKSAEQANPLKSVEKEKSLIGFGLDSLVTERLPSLRNIKLFRMNGDSDEVDLIRYFATADGAYNPYLRDGDKVVVPSLNLSANSISIQGAVNLPGRFEFHSGDSLSTLLRIANGPQPIADLQNAELVRFKSDGKSFERIFVDVQKVLDAKMDIPLQPDDRFFVRFKRLFREPFTVTVSGEVKRAGKYAITRDSTNLSEIIEQAGGFTPDAALAEGKVFRRTISDDPLMQNRDFERLTEMRLSGLDQDQRDYYNLEAAIRRGQVSVDFRKLFLKGDKSADVMLRSGDFILVPSRNKTVYVYGQVANPGFVTFVPGSDYRYYIEKAGGYSEEADKGRVSIIKAGTKKWVDAGEGLVEEGDGIFVSIRKVHDFGYYFVLVRDILTVATAGATVYFLIEQTKK